MSVRCTMTRTANKVTATRIKTTTVVQNIRRKRTVRTASLSRAKRIAASPDGVNDSFLAPLLQLAAQPIDVHFDDVGGPLPVGLPEAFAQHLARDHLAGMTHEQFENAEFR